MTEIGVRRERGKEQFALEQEIYLRWTFIHFVLVKGRLIITFKKL
jgi:hypothetical protein